MMAAATMQPQRQWHSHDAAVMTTTWPQHSRDDDDSSAPLYGGLFFAFDFE